MRPLRLDVEGFGTFRDATSLDFSDTDYFALVGPTGSGKTTVIDAICFALYGSAPRWPRRNQVSLAMAPSTGHTRVSLIFDAGGRRYAAVRALAKSARGQVSTKQSRLISLPPDIDLAGDLGDLLDQEADSLADSPAAMDDAVQRLLGLSYDHFTQSVVLPQGRFARFLHAEKRERQDLLVSLLGLGIYERVKQRANSLAEEAKTRAATLTDELGKYADATESAASAAATTLAELTRVQAGLDDLLAPWKEAARELEASAAVTGEHESDLDALGKISAPKGLDALIADRAETASIRKTAADEVTRAEAAELAAEEAARDAGRPGDWQQLITAHHQLDTLREQQATATQAVDHTTAALTEAVTNHDQAQQGCESARAALEKVRIAHQADDLATSLAAGQSCPVCLQTVATLPDRPAHQGITEAQARLREAETELESAATARTAAQRAHDRAADHAARLTEQITTAAADLKDRPTTADAQQALHHANQAEEALTTSRSAARTARSLLRQAEEAAQGLERQWSQAGLDLATARDQVSHLTPPAVTGDHAEDWETFTRWAAEKHGELGRRMTEAITRRDSAAAVEQERRTAVITALEAAGVSVTAADVTETSVVTAVATATSSARHQLERITERRAEAARLVRDIDDHERSAQLHRELGNLLNARNFERWIVEEALQSMMVEASASLSELSGGQFELTLDDKQDIQVIDHNDASSHRPVQTLSGGETFQASLALALALGSQIASMAPGAGQLDTILLDEGFGTLDPSTLDVVTGTLEQLSGGSERTVGLVTHVAALAERVPVRFEVSREGSRSSVTKVWA